MLVWFGQKAFHRYAPHNPAQIRPIAPNPMKIGIDLGTTNSALAYIDEREAEDRDFPPIHIFETPQLVAPGRTEPRRTLPSFLFLEDGQPVGVYAREQGALVPTKLVHSAKSWLSNPGVDRTAKILPWDSPETGRVLSPVEVSARYLAAFREAWDAGVGKARQLPLADQDIVLTVPASFDEEARELTVMAATGENSLHDKNREPTLTSRLCRRSRTQCEPRCGATLPGRLQRIKLGAIPCQDSLKIGYDG
jgi:hypothetical protein